MRRESGKRPRQLWPLLALVLPLALVASSLATLARLDQLRELYLRSRAAMIAARLETLPPSDPADLLDILSEQEDGLLDVRVYSPGQAGAEGASLAAIWEGRELFRTERLRSNDTDVFRAYIPFHAGTEMRVALVDLSVRSADFLLAPARQNVIVASVSGLVLALLALFALWSLRRSADLERRQLELEHLARLGRMSATLAHEIRNPLGTIKGFAQLAAERADAETGALLAPILDEARRLERLVSDLLAYGRPPQPELRWISWDALAAELEMHAGQVAVRPIRFIRTGGSPRLMTDPDMLKAALLNLVRNAVEALDETGSEVRLQAAASAREGVVLAVEDDGPGLSQEAQARLFEPFFTTKASGTGLGLAIARKLTEALGGEIRMVTRAPRGTRVELHFPRMKWEAAEEKEPTWKPS